MSGVVVGVDGTTSSDPALDLALLEAQTADEPLTVVYAYQAPAVHTGVEPSVSGASSRRAALVARAAVQRAAARLPTTSRVQVLVDVQAGVPGAVLRHVATGAHLLVIGACGSSRYRQSCLGDTARQLVGHPPCPIMLVPAAGPVAPVTRVVTGLSPTGETPRALRWAQSAAHRHDCDLLVVTAWQPGDMIAHGLDTADFERGLRARTTGLLQEAPTIRRPAQLRTCHGTAANALRAVLRSSDLLVLGTVGRAGQFPAGLPSTSGELVNDAPCPVVLVTDEQTPSAPKTRPARRPARPGADLRAGRDAGAPP